MKAQKKVLKVMYIEIHQNDFVKIYEMPLLLSKLTLVSSIFHPTKMLVLGTKQWTHILLGKMLGLHMVICLCITELSISLLRSFC